MDITTRFDFGNGLSITLDVNADSYVTKNFQIYELANKKSTDKVKLVLDSRALKFAGMIQELRDWFAKPMTVNSWYRTKSYNDLVSNDSKSRHMVGLAMDWGIVHNETQRKHVRDKWADICKAHGEIGRINFYSHGYHLSIGEEVYGYKTFQIVDYRGKKGDW